MVRYLLNVFLEEGDKKVITKEREIRWERLKTRGSTWSIKWKDELYLKKEDCFSPETKEGK
jgi:hypothetical protein